MVNYVAVNNRKKIQLWNNMYARCYYDCYQKTNPAYIGSTIAEEWLEGSEYHDHSTFFEWVEENYYTLEDMPVELDKDILVKGNKVYGPTTCIFVPKDVNNLLAIRRAKRDDLPVGVSYANKEKTLFRATIMIDGTSQDLGNTFPTAELAFEQYRLVKECAIKAKAEVYKGRIPNELYEALINWKVEITD